MMRSPILGLIMLALVQLAWSGWRLYRITRKASSQRGSVSSLNTESYTSPVSGRTSSPPTLNLFTTCQMWKRSYSDPGPTELNVSEYWKIVYWPVHIKTYKIINKLFRLYDLVLKWFGVGLECGLKCFLNFLLLHPPSWVLTWFFHTWKLHTIYKVRLQPHVIFILFITLFISKTTCEDITYHSILNANVGKEIYK